MLKIRKFIYSFVSIYCHEIVGKVFQIGEKVDNVKVGDVVGIVTSTVSKQTGKEARITVSGISTDVDTLYLEFRKTWPSIKLYREDGNKYTCQQLERWARRKRS